VPDSKTLKLLLVEDDLEDEQLLSEALIEIEENRQWCNWRTASVLHVEQLADARDCLRDAWFDVVLLNLSLPDSPVLLDSFHQINACARGAPVIVLADEEDENLANRLLREGAQDVLLKSELECAPLARSLRYAIERQRRNMIIGSSAFADDLTGSLTRPSFLAIATHYVQLSRLSRVTLLLASIEISEGPAETLDDRQARELLLLRAAEALGAAFEPPALIGRLGRSRFGLITAGLTETTLEALLNRAALAIEDAARSQGRPSATVRFSVAEIDQNTNLEEVLGQDGDDFAARTHRRAKTVMLAD
jgi:DNA-binding NarL/FixJ family response regulator